MSLWNNRSLTVILFYFSAVVYIYSAAYLRSVSELNTWHVRLSSMWFTLSTEDGRSTYKTLCNTTRHSDVLPVMTMRFPFGEPVFVPRVNFASYAEWLYIYLLNVCGDCAERFLKVKMKYVYAWRLFACILYIIIKVKKVCEAWMFFLEPCWEFLISLFFF